MGKKMSDQFDFEQSMFACWHVTDDLQVLCRTMDRREMKEDELQNYLLGLITIYNAKFETLQEHFESMLAQNRNESRQTLIDQLRNEWDDFGSEETLPIEDEL
jgi:hypothetical protein